MGNGGFRTGFISQLALTNKKCPSFEFFALESVQIGQSDYSKLLCPATPGLTY